MGISVKPLREEAIRVGYEATKDRLPIPFEAWQRALESWNVQAFCDGEKVVGMLMTKGPELHVAVLPEVRGKWLSRRLIREVFGPLLDRYGCAVTKVADANPRGDEFVSRLGFERMDGGYVKTLREGFASGAFDPVTATVGAGVLGLGGAAMQANAAENAAHDQAQATQYGVDEQRRQFDLTRKDQSPFLQTGQLASLKIRDLLGLGGGSGSLLKTFSPSDLTSDPGYQFGLTEGTKAIENAARARGTYMSPSTVKELLRYNQDYAGTKYGEAFNRDLTNRTTAYNMLSGSSGGGQVAAGNLAEAGQASASNIGNLVTSGANARGAAGIAAANAYGNAFNNIGNNAMQMMYLKQLFPNGIH